MRTTLRRSLKSYGIRHALGIGAAVFIAVYLDHYVSFSHQLWMPLAACLAGQTTRGTPLQQGMIFLVEMLAALFASWLLLMLPPLAEYVVIGAVFIIAAWYAYINYLQESRQFYAVMFFPLVLLIVALVPSSSRDILHERVMDFMMGGIIGIVCGQVILPVRLEKEFSEGVLDILRALTDHGKLILSSLDRLDKPDVLRATRGKYPEWVFELGFNPGLRSGFRFFLVNLDRMLEITFSMDYLVSIIDANLMQGMLNDLRDAMHKNQELLDILHEYFASKKLQDKVSDFTGDIQILENTLRGMVPANAELLDISPDYVAMTALVRNIKDYRDILLQMLVALPSG